MMAMPTDTPAAGQPAVGHMDARYSPLPALTVRTNQLLLAPAAPSCTPAERLGAPTVADQSPVGSGPWKPTSRRTAVCVSAGWLIPSRRLTEIERTPVDDCTTCELSTVTFARKRYLLATASCRYSASSTVGASPS